MKPLHGFLFGTSLLLAVHLHSSMSSSLGSPSFLTPAYFTPDPGSTVEVYKGSTIYGSPENIVLTKYAIDIVEYFDQDVLGKDTPVPVKIFVKDYLYDSTGRLFGIAGIQEQFIAMEGGRSAVDFAGTLLHERIHLLGHGEDAHDWIYDVQQRFCTWIASMGY